jgi:PPOX class probable F420-dependent enzyme
MAGGRTGITMTDEELSAFLDKGWTLQVASNGPRGYPHLVAMWYVMIDGVIHFTTYAKSQKVVNLQRDSRVTCMLEAGTSYAELQGLVIEGDAEVVANDADATLAVMRVVNGKYRGAPMTALPDDQLRRASTKRAVVRITPTRIYSWDHGKLSGGS